MAGSAERWDDVSTHDPAFQMIQPIRFGGEFGTSVAAVGGLNHDGIQDILAGVPLHSNFGAVGTADFNGDGTPRSWSGVRIKTQI